MQTSRSQGNVHESADPSSRQALPKHIPSKITASSVGRRTGAEEKDRLNAALHSPLLVSGEGEGGHLLPS